MTFLDVQSIFSRRFFMKIFSFVHPEMSLYLLKNDPLYAKNRHHLHKIKRPLNNIFFYCTKPIFLLLKAYFQQIYLLTNTDLWTKLVAMTSWHWHCFDFLSDIILYLLTNANGRCGKFIHDVTKRILGCWIKKCKQSFQTFSFVSKIFLFNFIKVDNIPLISNICCIF